MHERERGAAPAADDDEALETEDFRAPFEAAPGARVLLRPDAPRFTVVAVSDDFLRATGAERDLVVGRGLFERFPDANPDDPARDGARNVRASLETVLRTGLPHRMAVQRYDLRRADGGWEERHWLPVNVPVRAPDGRVRYLLHHAEDVTAEVRGRDERLRAESARARADAGRAREETARILRAASDGILGVDLEGRTTFANPAAERLLGWTAAELIGRKQHALIHHTRADGTPYPAGECALFRAVRDGVAGRVEDEVFWRKDGTSFPVEYGMTPAVEDGVVLGAVVTFRDVTERRQVEAERERLLDEARHARAAAEAANRAKSEFLATMSHELRTPLNAIAGYADLLEMGVHGPLADAQRDALARIQRSGRRLLSLINEVLNYARIEAGAVSFATRAVPVAEAVADAEALVAPQVRAKGLGYAWAGCAPSLAVCADPDKLQQILLNLLSNAVKFTESEGDRPGRVEASCGAGADGCVLIRVRDTGIGIPPEKLAAIFEPFVQVRSDLTRPHEGTGLGLAISRDLARGMGGELTVESEVGAGSTFTLALPKA